MSESYEVVAEALTRHASTLMSLAGELRAALSAAGSASMTGDAYGQTAARFASVVTELSGAGQEALQAGVDALEDAGTTLRATVTAYQGQESGGVERLASTGIGGTS